MTLVRSLAVVAALLLTPRVTYTSGAAAPSAFLTTEPILLVQVGATCHSRPRPRGSCPISRIPTSKPCTSALFSSRQEVEVDSFHHFIRMRLGFDTIAADVDALLPSSPGTSPSVYWVGSGELYEAYSGKILAKFEGFDVGKGMLIAPGHVRQLSRKIFWFRDPQSGEIMTEYKGQEVKPIRYDYQVFDYKRSPRSAGTNEIGEHDSAEPLDGFTGSIGSILPPILPSVVSGPRNVPLMPITAQTAGLDRLTFQAPIFVDIEIPNVGKYQAYEFYDYTVDRTYPQEQAPLVVLSRQGSNPPFVEDGKGVMRFLGHRVDTFDDLPKSIKRLVQDGKKQEGLDLFYAPPADVEEVERLIAKEQRKNE